MSPVKERLMDWCETTIRADFAEQVAAEIEDSIKPCVRLPACDRSFCWTCHDRAVAEATAAMIRRLGGVL